MLKAVPGVESVDCEMADGKPTGKVTVKTNKKVDAEALTKVVIGDKFSAKVAQ